MESLRPGPGREYLTMSGLREEDIRIPEGYGRDTGKVFRIKELDVLEFDRLANRMVALVTGSGARIPFNLAGRGAEAIAIVGINAILQAPVDPDKMQPILEELLNKTTKCVRTPDLPNRAPGAEDRRPLATDLWATPNDIMELKTLWFLRSEVLRVHTGFSLRENLSRWIAGVMASASENIPT